MADTKTLGAGERQSLIEQAEHLHTRLIQLHASLVMTYGEPGESFRLLANDIQDNYMWGLTDRCDALADLAAELSSAIASNGAECAMTKQSTLAEAQKELEAAHAIIRHALNLMTPTQKAAWALQNESSGVAGEGATRANERESCIERLQSAGFASYNEVSHG